MPAPGRGFHVSSVTIQVNGVAQTREVEPRMLLVHFLRDELGLTGTHVGCDTSQCGACTVKGLYVDAVRLPDPPFAAFVRSRHAHAKIRSLDASAAKNLKGVLAVHTGKYLIDPGVKPIPVGWLLPGWKIPPRHALAV